MSSNSTPRSSARRPRRPGDAKHHPLAVDVDTLLDENFTLGPEGPFRPQL